MDAGFSFGEELRAALGSPRRVRRIASSPRSAVWRAELGQVPVIVKQVVGGPDAGQRFQREVTALRLAALAAPAGQAGPPVAAALLGTDPAARVLVLERLSHRRPAPGWQVGYAEALARLHAAGWPDRAGELPRWSGPTSGDVSSFLRLARWLGVRVAPGVEDQLAGLIERLGRAPARALLHGDPCPGNDLHTPSGIRFVDFEQASAGDGLTELAYLRIGFPTCWCVTAASEALLRRAEAAYAAAWQAATGTSLAGDLTDACAGWLLRGDALVERADRGTTDHLARLAAGDWRWGTATARGRLAHRLDVVAGLTAGHPALDALGTLAASMRASMLARWPALPPPPATRPWPS